VNDTAGNVAIQVTRTVTVNETCRTEMNDTIATGDEYTKEICTTLEKPKFEITAPAYETRVGMSINPRTGKLYWTPMPDQTGTIDVEVTMTDSAGTSEVSTLKLTVNDEGFTVPNNAYFFAPNAEDGNKNKHPLGTYDAPYFSGKTLCGKILKDKAPGKTFYYRGGTFYNRAFGTVDATSIPEMTCSGEANNRLSIRPWGNEKPKIKFDSPLAYRIGGSYINIEGFEIEGMNQEVTYEEALNSWWITPWKSNGNGIVCNGSHVTIRDNIVHHVPAQGINAQNGDYIIIEDNIVYNSAWWTTKGTTGIGMTDTVASDTISSDPTSNAQNMVIKSNLVFGVESRVFSRIFKKPVGILAIDEGESLLLQINTGDYKARYLIKDNFLLFNGKGIVVNTTSPDISPQYADIISNTLYHTGTTIGTTAKGLRGNKAEELVMKNNAVKIFGNGDADSTKTTRSQRIYENNYLDGNDTEKKNYVPIDGRNFVRPVFKDPDNLDFTMADGLPSNVGASQATFEKHKAKMKEHGVEIKPTGWVPDYQDITKRIIDNIPAGINADFSHWNDTEEFEIPLTNVPGAKNGKFILLIEYPYVKDF
jgi:hypothetical protein